MMKNFIKSHIDGYLLPATIMLGLGISVMAGTYLSYLATTSNSLNEQSYDSIAEEAALSGIAYADSCLSQDKWKSTNPLTTGTDCEGSIGGGGSQFITVKDKEWRSKFTVMPKDATETITSIGTVEILNASNQSVQSFTATKKMNLGKQFNTTPISTGESITDIKNDQTDCAIANGKLYCWGDNTYGQLGRGYFGNTVPGGRPSKGTPVDVGSIAGSALAGKTVTNVSVAYSTVCAIAEGQPYCWGDNSFGQLGDGGSGDKAIPTANVPRTSSGVLQGKKIVEISTASQNNPASLIWPYSRADPHTCALTDEGAMSCWGDGDFRQLTGGGAYPDINWICDPILQWICVPWPGLFYSYPSSKSPLLVKGYDDNTGPFRGKKAERVAASSHDSCLLAEGRVYCMGVPAPLNPLCWIPPLGLFSGSSDTLIWAPFNVCIGSYSNGYDVSALNSTMEGKFVDPKSFEISANEGCWMANKRWVCFGTTPAFTPLWFDAWGEPRVTISGDTDVTSSDNGDNIPSWGVIGMYCLVDRGEAKCAGNLGNGSTGTGHSGYKNFQPLIKTSGLAGKTPTKIASGQDHGCVIANGQLLCWGRDWSGVLADGNSDANWVGTATVTGDNEIGTASGTIAASGAISSGGRHSCGVANGDLFCWGDNSNGQLGTGNTNPSSGPLALPFFNKDTNNDGEEDFKDVTKVSAGANHTCAISYGDLYCWGDNSNGQLGFGNINNVPANRAPQLVPGFAGKRVTDVSAGATGTCAVADGKAYCWGDNTTRQLGRGFSGNTAATSSPAVVTGALAPADLAVTSVSIGTTHACAVANADLFCWGDNTNGRTGLNTTAATISNPTRVSAGTAGSPLGENNMTPFVTGVSAGDNFTCAIIRAEVNCFGDNTDGQLGRGYTGNTPPFLQPSIAVPAKVNGAASDYYATTVSAGSGYACALLHGNSSVTNGNMYCWGKGTNGQLGYGNNGSRNNVTTPINGKDTVDSSAPAGKQRRVATAISAGSTSTCGVANGVILCWGENSDGQLGLGSTSNSSSYHAPTKSADYKYQMPYTKGPIF